MTNVIIESPSQTNISNGIVSITMVDQDNSIINVKNESIEIGFTDVGYQGLPGAQGVQGPKGDVGDPLDFEHLTEQQKLELRGDVGNTSTNYTNIFLNSLLS